MTHTPYHTATGMAAVLSYLPAPRAEQVGRHCKTTERPLEGASTMRKKSAIRLGQAASVVALAAGLAGTGIAVASPSDGSGSGTEQHLREMDQHMRTMLDTMPPELHDDAERMHEQMRPMMEQMPMEHRPMMSHPDGMMG